MRSSRIFTPLPLQSGLEAELDPDASHHLARVLRIKPGEEFTLFNGDGSEYRARLDATRRRAALVSILERSRVEAEPRLNIALGLSVSKGERMDFSIQKSVELGVSEIAPLMTERTVVRMNPQRLEKRELHWQGVLRSACEQSGRCRIPKLRQTTPLEAWLDESRSHRMTTLVLDQRADETLDQIVPRGEWVTILVGPEGGLSFSELERARERGFQTIRLGPHVLRTETAPLAAIAAMQALWGEFRSD